MKDWMIGQGVILYIFAGCLAVGLLSAFIANHGYKRLIRESELMGNTGNRLLKYIKLKFGSYYKLNMRPQDTRALTRHYMYKYKIGFMNVQSWIKLSKLCAGAVAIAALVDLLWMVAQGKTLTDMVNMVGCAAIGCALIYIQHRLYDFPEKQTMLEWYLMDYLENFLKNKIESAKRNNAEAVKVREDQMSRSRTAVLEADNKTSQGIYKDIRKKTYPAADDARYAAVSQSLDDSVPASGRSANGRLSEVKGEKFNNNLQERMDREQSGHNDHEAAAASTRGGFGRNGGNDHFSLEPDSGPEDEIDAKIVEDILKEFLN